MTEQELGEFIELMSEEYNKLEHKSARKEIVDTLLERIKELEANQCECGDISTYDIS